MPVSKAINDSPASKRYIPTNPSFTYKRFADIEPLIFFRSAVLTSPELTKLLTLLEPHGRSAINRREACVPDPLYVLLALLLAYRLSKYSVNRSGKS